MSIVSPLSGPPLYRYIPGVGKVGTTQNGPIGPTGPQGAPGTSTGTGATGSTGPTGPAGFQTYTGPTGSILFYNGAAVTGRADFTLTDSTLKIPGNMIPSLNNTYTLGATGARWKDVLVGPGSINIALPGGTGSATIGTDAAGLVYTEFGFATPKIAIGPAQLTPQAVGGWQIGPTGTQGTSGYALVAQELQANGSGPTGPIYQLAPNSLTGPTGAASTVTGPTGAASTVTGPTGAASTVTGPTGPTGARGPTGSSPSIPSAFLSSTGPVTLATGPTGTQISSMNLTTTQTGHIWAVSSVMVQNTANGTDYDVTLYMYVDGFKSDGPTVSVQRKILNSTNVEATFQMRSTSQLGPGTWPITTYGYTSASTTSVTAQHKDLFAIGHLG